MFFVMILMSLPFQKVNEIRKIWSPEQKEWFFKPYRDVKLFKATYTVNDLK